MSDATIEADPVQWLGRWVGQPVSVALRSGGLAGVVTLEGTLRAAGTAGVVIEVRGSTTFVPVTSILHLTHRADR